MVSGWLFEVFLLYVAKLKHNAEIEIKNCFPVSFTCPATYSFARDKV